ncbi:isochorismatase family protein [Methanococcoides sp. SA1]|nr:isochorismatase family protein [Methanococcoides sp. SA1]
MKPKIVILIIIIQCFLFSKSQAQNIFDNKYLIVLDAQEYYTNGKLTDISTQDVINSINQTINKIDKNNVAFVTRKHKLLNLSLSFPFIYTSYDSSAMQIDNRLDLVNNNIFTREKSNAFSINELCNFLKQKNAKEIIMIGFLADEYLYDSILEGKKLGYDMYVIPQAIIGKSQKGKIESIKKLIKNEIKILEIE